MGKLRVEKGKGFRSALFGGCWHGEAVNGLTYVIGQEGMFDFFQLDLTWKKGKKSRKLPVINQFLVV